MKKILQLMESIMLFILGKLLLLFMYDTRYLNGKYYNHNIKNIFSLIWRWTVVDWFGRVFLGFNKSIPWPVSPKATVTNPQNILFDPNDLHIFQSPGTYFQAIGAKIIIGKGTWIGPNVGLITANHDIDDLTRHYQGSEINIGKNCWIGMNSTILPGVILGEKTIVGAGSVVTKSFKEGFVMIGGNPAKIIRILKNNEEDI